MTRPPADLLADFVGKYRSDGAAGGPLDIEQVLSYPEDYPLPYLSTLLDGLERIALIQDASRLGVYAVYNMARAGDRSKPRPVSTFARLERIYRSSTDGGVRAAVLGAMVPLAERDQALAFLERVATREVEDFGGSVDMALAMLVGMDDEGRAVLKRLHETNAVHEPEARYRLSVLAGHGYRIPKPDPRPPESR